MWNTWNSCFVALGRIRVENAVPPLQPFLCQRCPFNFPDCAGTQNDVEEALDNTSVPHVAPWKVHGGELAGDVIMNVGAEISYREYFATSSLA